MSGYIDKLYFGTPWWQDSYLCRLALAAGATLLFLACVTFWPAGESETGLFSLSPPPHKSPSPRSGFDVVSDLGIVEVDSVHGQPVKVVPGEDGRVIYYWKKPETKLSDSKSATS